MPALPLAAAARRTGVLPTWLAVGIGLSWILTLVGSPVGGGIVAGAFWLALGWMLKHDELPRPAIRRADSVSA